MWATFAGAEFLRTLSTCSNREKENLSSYVHDLLKTSHWEVSRRSGALDVNLRNVLKSVMHVQSCCFDHKAICFLTLSLSS